MSSIAPVEDVIRSVKTILLLHRQTKIYDVKLMLIKIDKGPSNASTEGLDTSKTSYTFCRNPKNPQETPRILAESGESGFNPTQEGLYCEDRKSILLLDYRGKADGILVFCVGVLI